MAIDWWTIGLQAANFLILIWLLQRFLYRPVLAALDRRRTAVEMLKAAARDAQAKADAAEADWRRRQDALRQQGVDLHRQAEADAAAHRERILADARRDAEGLREQARRQIADDRAAALAELRRQGARLAVTLSRRLLAAAAPGVGPEPFLAVLERHWLSLPESQRRQFLERLPPDAVRVEVMPPLTSPDAWAARLSALFGGRAVVFDETPALIGGARVVLGGTSIGVAWADSLSEAGEEMEGHVEPA